MKLIIVLLGLVAMSCSKDSEVQRETEAKAKQLPACLLKEIYCQELLRLDTARARIQWMERLDKESGTTDSGQRRSLTKERLLAEDSLAEMRARLEQVAPLPTDKKCIGLRKTGFCEKEAALLESLRE